MGIHKMPISGEELDKIIMEHPKVQYHCADCGDLQYTTFFDRRADLLIQEFIEESNQRRGFHMVGLKKRKN